MQNILQNEHIIGSKEVFPHLRKVISLHGFLFQNVRFLREALFGFKVDLISFPTGLPLYLPCPPPPPPPLTLPCDVADGDGVL